MKNELNNKRREEEELKFKQAAETQRKLLQQYTPEVQQENPDMNDILTACIKAQEQANIWVE